MSGRAPKVWNSGCQCSSNAPAAKPPVCSSSRSQNQRERMLTATSPASGRIGSMLRRIVSSGGSPTACTSGLPLARCSRSAGVSGGNAPVSPNSGVTSSPRRIHAAPQRSPTCCCSVANASRSTPSARASSRTNARSPATWLNRAAMPMPAVLAALCSEFARSPRIWSLVRVTTSHANTSSGTRAHPANNATNRRPMRDVRLPNARVRESVIAERPDHRRARPRGRPRRRCGARPRCRAA